METVLEVVIRCHSPQEARRLWGRLRRMVPQSGSRVLAVLLVTGPVSRPEPSTEVLYAAARPSHT